MKIYNRADFLQLPAGTVYCKWAPCHFGQLEIKVSDPGEWGNDFVTDNLTDYLEYPERDLHYFKPGDTMRWAYDQTVRDGLFETDEEALFAVYDNQDIQQAIDKLTKCLKP